jgi:WD40 repeat protein
MVPFSEADRERFFGRDREVQELVERLRLHPFLTVIGPSGSGKSSLVFAGLIPALRQSRLFGPGEWLVQVVRPGETPLDALTGALHGDLADPAKTVSELLAAQPNAHRLLLVIDQFEELFTQARSDIEPFQQALLRLTQVPHCYVLLTVRADFYPDLMATPLWRDIQTHRTEVLPLDKDGLGQAIVRPAQSVGVFVEDGLVERLLADAVGEPGILPLVQETLVLLWERLEQRFLPLHAYETLGGPGRTGLQVAMARRADAALANLTPVQQAMARRVFLRLVQFGEGRADTRRQQSVAALRAAGDDPIVFDRTLRHLADLRLLTLSGEEMLVDQRVDIAHEALIAGWPTLQGWIAQRREAEQTRRQLEAKAVEWVRLGRGSGGLLDEVELAEADRWLSSPDATDLGYTTALDALARDSRTALERFQAEKEATRQRELKLAQEKAEAEKRRAEEQVLAAGHLRARNRIITAIGALALIAAVAAGVLGWRSEWNAGQARRSAATAEAASTRAVAQQATAEVASTRAVAQQATAVSNANSRATAEAIAVEQRNDAQQQNRLATARSLAAAAINNLGTDAERSVLLALQAVAVTYSIDRTVVPEAEDALHQAVQNSHVRHTLTGHSDKIAKIVFSPDGKRLATASNDHTAKVWDVETGKELLTLSGHTAEISDIAFSSDGERLATLSEAAKEWDAETGKELFTFPLTSQYNTRMNFSGHYLALAGNDGTVDVWNPGSGRKMYSLSGHKDSIISIASAYYSERLATLSIDNTAKVWDLRTGKELLTLSDLSKDDLKLLVMRVVLDSQGKRLAIVDLDGMKVWDIQTGKELMTFFDLGGLAQGFAFSPDWKYLATARGTVKIREVETGKALIELPSSIGFINQMVFSPDGMRLAIAKSDHTVEVWAVETGRELFVLTGHTDAVTCVAFSPDGKRLATASDDRTVKIWDIDSGGDEVYSFFGGNFAFSSDGRRVATANYGSTAEVLNVETGKELINISTYNLSVTRVALSPDGKRLATASDVGLTKVWNVETGQEISTLSGQSINVSDMVFNPDGKRLATTSDENSDENTVKLWNAETGRELHTLSGHTSVVLSIAFSPDGVRLATATYDRTKVWDVETGKELFTIYREPGMDSAGTFSLDGRLLATHSTSESISGTAIRLWDAATGKELLTLLGHSKEIRSFVFSPDSKHLATGSADHTARVWDTETGKELLILSGHTGNVESVAFSPDGKRLATASFDYTVKVWNVETGQRLFTLPGHDKAVGYVAFTSDGRHIITVDAGYMHVYNVSVADLVAVARSRLTRTWRLDECRQYLQMNTCPPTP